MTTNQWTKFFTFEGLQSMMKEFSSPVFDTDSMLETQKKNVESLTNLARHTMENLKEMGEMQQQYVQQYMDNLRETTQQMLRPGDWQEKMNQGSEFVNTTMNDVVNHSNTTMEFLRRSNQQATENVQNRFSESMAENLHQVKKASNAKRK